MNKQKSAKSTGNGKKKQFDWTGQCLDLYEGNMQQNSLKPVEERIEVLRFVLLKTDFLLKNRNLLRVTFDSLV